MRPRFLFALLFLASFLAAQSPLPERPAYVFFSYINLGDAEQRINDYAADGFQLVGFQFSLSGAVVVAVRDIAPLGEARYEYTLVGGHFQRYVKDKQPLPAQLTSLGSEGWRVVPGSLLNMDPETWNSVANENAFVMERVRGSSTPIEYRLEREMMTSNAIKDVQRDLRDGFSLLMSYPFSGQRASLLERRATRGELSDAGAVEPISGARDLEIVNFTPKHMGDKLDDAARRGRHLLALSSAPEGYFSAVFAAVPSAPPSVYVYGDIASRGDSTHFTAEEWATVEQQLNEAAANGYAISIRPIFLSRSNFSGREVRLHYVIPMEASANKLQYRIVATETLPDLSADVNQAAAEGWTIVPGLLYGDGTVFLERAEPLPQTEEVDP